MAEDYAAVLNEETLNRPFKGQSPKEGSYRVLLLGPGGN